MQSGSLHMLYTQLTPRVEMFLRGIKESKVRDSHQDMITYHNPYNVQAKTANTTESSRL